MEVISSAQGEVEAPEDDAEVSLSHLSAVALSRTYPSALQQFLTLTPPTQGVTVRLSSALQLGEGGGAGGNLLALSNLFGWVVAAGNDGELARGKRAALGADELEDAGWEGMLVRAGAEVVESSACFSSSFERSQQLAHASWGVCSSADDTLRCFHYRALGSRLGGADWAEKVMPPQSA
jgi:hypothetical protein